MMDWKLYDRMEIEYLYRGASRNAAQLTMRYDALKQLLKEYSGDELLEILNADFYRFHEMMKREILKECK